MSIRPVSRCLPKSQALWEDTNLPMCVVVTPCEEDDEDEDVDEEEAEAEAAADLAKPLSAIPKCLNCGAPHPTSATHFRPQYSSVLLCYLCGKTSSTIFTDQQDARVDEYLDIDTYDKTSMHEFSKHKHLDFRVPLEVKDPTVPSSLVWQLPAVACPPVWWIVIDGTVGGKSHHPQATRNYWKTIERVIDRTLEEIPSHVHIGMVTATSTRLACWDFVTAGSPSAKQSSVPTVKHIPYTYTPSTDSNVDKDDDDDDTNNAWDLSIVPANETYKESIQAAVHAMVEGANQGLFLDEQPSGGGEEKKEESESDDTTTGFPLGLTLEILLEFMEQAKHPGLSAADVESTDGGKNTKTKKKTTLSPRYAAPLSNSTELRYAGGKILCLLGNPPMEIVPATGKDSIDPTSSQPPFHQGGVAGACFPNDTEDRWSIDSSKTKNKKDDKKKKKKGDDCRPYRSNTI